MATPVLLVTGKLGSGKTEVIREVNEVLRLRGVSNATIDLDWLGKGRPSAAGTIPPLKYGTYAADLIFENLKAMWPNYQRRGVERLLVGRVIEDRAELDGYVDAVPGAEVTVCRLIAPREVIQARIRKRELGLSREFLLRLADVAEARLDEMMVESFRVVNDGTVPLTDVADEIIERSGW